MSRKIAILDTTLRDGEQAPGASMNADEKVVVARQLIRLGVDVIEAGFPHSSPGDFRAVQEIGLLAGKSCTVCAFARAKEIDIKKAAEALSTAQHSRIHLGIGVSAIHIKDKLHMTEDEVLTAIKDSVTLAASLVDEVEFYAEDAGRADRDFLLKAVRCAVDAGATIINIPDTTGFCLPDQYKDIIKAVVDFTTDDNVVIAAHTHDDLGLATANALAAVQAGASQVECAVNGIGERAGNAALEEIAVALSLHEKVFDAHTDIKLRELQRASRLVSRVTGMNVQANKAIVGANAFAHSAGIHQDGVLKSPKTYEIIDPTSVGSIGSEIILTIRSGRSALEHRLVELGYKFNEEEFDVLYQRFLEIADQKKEVYDEDLESMVEEQSRAVTALYTLDALQIQCGSPLVPTAVATITDENGEQHIVSSFGTGPVDAAYKAIDKVVSAHGDLEEYAVKAITRGIDAIGEVVVRVRASDGRLYTGRGADGDVIVSSAKAYINAINRMITMQRSREE